MKTLFHNVIFPENQKIEEDDYYYCSSVNCKTGYFSTSGNTIPKQHLRARQDIQKGWLCYCYDISESDYLKALHSKSAESIKTYVIQQTKSGSCACEVRNPSGQCCLAKFKQLEKEYLVTHRLQLNEQ